MRILAKLSDNDNAFLAYVQDKKAANVPLSEEELDLFKKISAKMASVEDKENPLITNIQEDNKLDFLTKLKFSAMAKLLLKDFKDNITLSSLDLANKYFDYSADDWLAFLSTPVVKKYMAPFKNELALASVDNQLSQGKATSTTVALRNELERNSRSSNAGLVVMLLPYPSNPSHNVV